MTREQFFNDCGLSSRPSLIVEGPGRENEAVFELRRPYLVIGRGPRAGLRLEDPSVSGRHAYMQFLRGRPFIVDLGSRLGVRWGDLKQPSGWLDGPEGVQIGSYRLRFEGFNTATDGGPNDDPMATDSAAHLPRTSLEFLGRRVGYPAWPMDRELTLIGRSRDCKVRLSGPEVSRHHCALIRTPGGVWAIDLASRKRIHINGRPARWSRLLPGDELIIGTHRIRLGLAPGPSTELQPAIRPSSQTELAMITEAGPPQVELVESLVEQLNRMQGQMFDHFQQSMVTVLQMFGAMHRDQLELLRQELDELRRAMAEGRPAPAPDRSASSAPLPSSGPASPKAHPVQDQSKPPETGEPTEPLDQVSREMHRILAHRVAALRHEQKSSWQKILAMMSGQPNGDDGR